MIDHYDNMIAMKYIGYKKTEAHYNLHHILIHVAQNNSPGHQFVSLLKSFSIDLPSETLY